MFYGERIIDSFLNVRSTIKILLPLTTDSLFVYDTFEDVYMELFDLEEITSHHLFVPVFILFIFVLLLIGSFDLYGYTCKRRLNGKDCNCASGPEVYIRKKSGEESRGSLSAISTGSWKSAMHLKREFCCHLKYRGTTSRAVCLRIRYEVLWSRH